LESEETAESGIIQDAFINGFEIRRLSQPIWEPIGHQTGDQREMIGVLARTAEGWSGHDIGGRIDTLTAGLQAAKRAIDGLEIDRLPR
jgi:hypothetical protein